MEQSNRNRGNTKTAVKMAAGGGIGAVVLLATAALASAFVVGRNGRSFVKDRRCHKTPPGDDPDKTHRSNVVEDKNPSNGAIVGSDNHTSALDEKPSVEGINIGDIEATEQSIGSTILEKLATDAISDGSVIIIEEKKPLLDEKLQLEPQNEDADNEISEEGQNPEQVRIGGGMAESEPTDDECDGEIKETCHQKAGDLISEKQPVKVENGEQLLCCDHEEIKVILVDNSVDEKVHDDQKEAEDNVNATEVGELDEGKRSDNGEVELSESHSKDGPLLGSPAMGHENVNGEEKEGRSFTSETVEIVKECEFIEEQSVEDDKKTILPVLGSLAVGHENTNDGEKEGRPFPTNTLEIEKECEFIEEQLVEDGQKTVLPVLASLDVEQKKTTGDEKQGLPFPTDTVEIVKECEFIKEELVEDGQKKVLDVLGNHAVDHEDMNGDEEKAHLTVETAEIILEDSELIEAGVDDPVDNVVEDHLAKEQENSGDDADELIVVKKHEDPIEKTGGETPLDISTVSPMLQEEVISISHESIQVAKNNVNDLEPEIEKEAEEEPISLQNVKVMKEDNAMNEEVVDISTEAIAGIENSPVIVTATISDVPVAKKIKDGEKGENLTEDSVEDRDEKEVNYSGKALIGKYVTDLAALNDRLTGSTSRRMMIVTLSTASSISCSWFFGLSLARLCLVMFLTMVLSSMVVTA